MVFILAASSLQHAIKTLPQALQDHYKKWNYPILGQYHLSFNPNAVKARKTAPFQLIYFFRDKNRLVIRHNVVNNSLSRHRSNKNKPLTPSQLIAVLENYHKRIDAILHCLREVTPDKYGQLKRSTLVTIHIVKDIVSKRKQKNPNLLKDYRALHQRPALELKTLTMC